MCGIAVKALVDGGGSGRRRRMSDRMQRRGRRLRNVAARALGLRASTVDLIDLSAPASSPWSIASLPFARLQRVHLQLPRASR